jgi:HPt (histidine-containing phosphotransfer) domain-containing protein/two-component sensor histidine kinase
LIVVDGGVDDHDLWGLSTHARDQLLAYQLSRFLRVRLYDQMTKCGESCHRRFIVPIDVILSSLLIPDHRSDETNRVDPDRGAPEDASILRDKAILLLRRERELLALRMAHETTSSWLAVAQMLPGHFDPNVPVSESYSRVARSLIRCLKYQKAMFFESGQGTLRHLGKLVKPDRALNGEVQALLRSKPSGLCNDPSDPTLTKLATLTGLHRFMWASCEPPGPSLLMVAGFDRERAEFYLPFEDSDLAQFRNMSQQLWVLVRNRLLILEVQESNKKLEALSVSLEQTVEERTRELSLRGRDMRLVLDNVAQGFLTIDRCGYLAQEHSAIIERWFGPYEGEITFAEYAASFNYEFSDLFQLGHEALVEGILPRDLCLAQLPKRFRWKDREFRCTYSCIDDDGQDAGLLIVISDITAQLAKEQMEAEQQEAIALFQGIMRDRRGYLTFFSETNRLMEQLSSSGRDLITVKGLLHTLKGSADAASLHALATLCHRAEDALIENQAVPQASMAALSKHWLLLSQTMRSLLGESDAQVLALDGREIDRLYVQIEQGAPTSAILSQLRFLRLEPVELAFSRMGNYARELAIRLGKGDVEVTIDARGVRVDPRVCAPLWTDLVHLVRNAVDHGLERPDVRRRAGKPERLHLRFEADVTQGQLLVVVGDDGQGIDWPEVRRVAEQHGLPFGAESDLVNALCTPKVSTRGTATDTSGRGMGLAVVSERVRQMGGRLTVNSSVGLGTTWSLSFPLSTRENSDHAIAAAMKPLPVGVSNGLLS